MRRRAKAKRITAEQLDKLPGPTLEDLLAVMNGGHYASFFRQRPLVAVHDGRETSDHLTRAGAKAYYRLVALLYAVARCTGVGQSGSDCTMKGVVDRLDDICNDHT